MGTPELAATVLRLMCLGGRTPVCCVTQKDKPAGRGYKLMPSAVKRYATEAGIPVLQPSKLSEPEFADALEQYAPDVIVVAAYGKLLPRSVLEYPRFGCLNVHGSLLPKYRGAAPIQRAIMDGCDRTGVTIMRMAEGLDTGDMLLKLETPITESDNLETVHDRLAELGAEGILKALELCESGNAVYEKQDDALASYAAKITNLDAVLDFTRSAKELSAQIRGLSPFPCAYCRNGETLLKLTDARAVDERQPNAECGEVTSVNGGVIEVACGSGTLRILGVFPENRRRMSAADYINGGKLKKGDMLTAACG